MPTNSCPVLGTVGLTSSQRPFNNDNNYNKPTDVTVYLPIIYYKWNISQQSQDCYCYTGLQIVRRHCCEPLHKAISVQTIITKLLETCVEDRQLKTTSVIVVVLK